MNSKALMQLSPSVLGVVALLWFAPSANAGWINCPPNSIENEVTGTSGCAYADSDPTAGGNVTLDFLNTTSTANPTLFNQTDWMGFDYKLDIDGHVVSGSNWLDLTITGNAQSGTWEIDNYVVGSNTVQVALIFKDGNNLSPSTLAAYLLDGVALAGVWNSPFRDPPFTGGGASANVAKDTSNITAFYRITGDAPNPEPAPVPIPAPLALLGLGGLILGWITRKSRV